MPKSRPQKKEKVKLKLKPKLQKLNNVQFTVLGAGLVKK
jgi:hypothetical protein